MRKSKVGKMFLLATAVACGVASFGMLGAHASASAASGLCEVDGVTYQTLGEGVAHWEQGTTLKLLQNCDLADVGEKYSLPVTVSKTLDLNGKTLRGTGADSVLRVTGTGVTFTVTDTSAEKSGKISEGGAILGGGIFLSEATLELNGGAITQNRASSGGGIYASDATVHLNGGSVCENTAGYGGGIELKGGSMLLSEDTECTIEGNTATVNGGGVYALGSDTASATLTVGGGKIGGNTAEKGGGVALWGGAVLTLSAGGEISENHADGGAGVYAFGATTDGTVTKPATFHMTGGRVNANVGGTGFGAGVKIGLGGVFHMTGGTVSQNTTRMNGGAFPSITAAKRRSAARRK